MTEEQLEMIKKIAKERFDSFIYTRTNFDMPLHKLDWELFDEMVSACADAFEAGSKIFNGE